MSPDLPLSFCSPILAPPPVPNPLPSFIFSSLQPSFMSIFPIGGPSIPRRNATAFQLSPFGHPHCTHHPLIITQPSSFQLEQCIYFLILYFYYYQVLVLSFALRPSDPDWLS